MFALHAALQSGHHQLQGTLVLPNFLLSKFWSWNYSKLNQHLPIPQPSTPPHLQDQCHFLHTASSHQRNARFLTTHYDHNEVRNVEYEAFHFLIACSKPALNNNGLGTSPCFTPRLIGNCRPCTNPTWSWYNESISFKYADGTPCAVKASNNALYSIRSKVFRKSKLAHHIGTDHSIDFEHTFY